MLRKFFIRFVPENYWAHGEGIRRNAWDTSKISEKAKSNEQPFLLIGERLCTATSAWMSERSDAEPGGAEPGRLSGLPWEEGDSSIPRAARALSDESASAAGVEPIRRSFRGTHCRVKL